ncbi:Lactose transport system permease protein LacF [subsurface metagenome]
MRLTGNKSRTKRKGASLPGRMVRQEERAAYIFLLPWLCGLLFIMIGPLIASFVLSLTHYTLITPPRWAGFENYREMLTNFYFLKSIKVTITYLILFVPCNLVVGLSLAMLLNRAIKGINLFRTIFYLPAVFAPTAVAVLWRFLYNPAFGPINVVLRSIGVANPPRWLVDPLWAVPSVIFMMMWRVGEQMIIYLAGLKNIPPTLYEVADIDGASAWQKFIKVTLPMLSPTIFFMLIISLSDAFQIFDQVYVLGGATGSRGGRGSNLLFYMLNVWNEGFRNMRLGYASALAWVLIIIAAIVVILTFKSSEGLVYYEHETTKR